MFQISRFKIQGKEGLPSVTFCGKSGGGFTILEIIIAIAVITLAVGSLVALTSFSVSTVPVSKQKLVATYLAQEGIEIVRNIRDKNFLQDQNWRIGISSGAWEIDYGTASLSQAYASNFLRVNSNGYYNYAAGILTQFQRKITISDNPDGDATSEDISVKSEIIWQDKGKAYSVALESWLYNWQ